MFKSSEPVLTQLLIANPLFNIRNLFDRRNHQAFMFDTENGYPDEERSVVVGLTWHYDS